VTRAKGSKSRIRYDWTYTREQLIRHPRKWGLVWETDDADDANSALKAFANHKRYGFTAVSRKVDTRTWQVWAVYRPTRYSETIPSLYEPPDVQVWADNPPPIRHFDRITT